MLNIIIAKKLNTFIGKPNEEELQFLLDHTFEDHKMEGSVALHGKFGTETVILDFEVEKGKVVAVNFLIPKKMQLFKCTYQPSSTRLFSNLDMYIKLKKKLHTFLLFQIYYPFCFLLEHNVIEKRIFFPYTNNIFF